MNIVYKTLPGRLHTAQNIANQDAVKVFQNDTISIIVVCDGVSASSCASVAAELTADVAVKFLKRSDIFFLKTRELKNKLIQELDKAYLSSGYDYDQLACTLSAVLVNNEINSHLCINIGDSSIVGISDNLEAKLIAEPKNLFGSKRLTVTANSDMAKNSMQIYYGDAECDNLVGFVILTDGANSLIEHGNETIPQLAAATVLNKDKAQLHLEETLENIRSSKTNDDVTLAIAVVSAREATRIAEIAKAFCTLDTDKPDDDNNDMIDELNLDSLKEIECEKISFEPDEPSEVENDTDGTAPLSLLEFTIEPKTAAEILAAGYVSESHFFETLKPYLKDGLIVYNDGKFVSTITVERRRT